MRFQHFFVLLFSIVFASSCEKEIDYETGWVGDWEVYQVDSAYVVPGITDTIVPLVNYSVTGKVFFEEDSTGYFELSSQFSCQGSEKFSWELFKGAEDSLLFTFNSGKKDLIIATKMEPTELVFYRPTCNPSPGIGSMAIYQFHCRR